MTGAKGVSKRERSAGRAVDAPVERRHGDLLISTDRARLDLDVIHGFLSRAYWSEGIPRNLVERAVRHSICFGVYSADQQVGFARVISDCATYAYVADVFIVETHRGRGLSKRLMEAILAHPDLQGLRRWGLVTRDAHGLYRQYGFTAPKMPERYMEITRPGLYRVGGAGGESTHAGEASGAHR